MGVSPPFDGIAASLQAARAHWGTRAGALVWQPAPPGRGCAARARRLAAGVWLLDGHLVEGTGAPWDAPAPPADWLAALHGQAWLDDFAASDDAAARAALRAWVWDWIARYGRGTGPGWRPDLVARRLTRWIAHGIALMAGAEAADGAALLRACAVHARYLDLRWRAIAPGLPRIEALAARVHARLGLEDGRPRLDAALADLGQAADALVDPSGGLPSRNADDVLAVCAQLDWARHLIEGAGLSADPGHLAALARGLGALRGLRHADGRLPRFHGGTGGDPAALEGLLRTPLGLAPPGAPLGLIRRAAGGAVLVLDAAPPPGGPHGHASQLALEFSAAGHALILGCAAGRLTADHSALEVAGVATGRLVAQPGGGAHLHATGAVEAQCARDASGDWVIARSAAYLDTLGLTHDRRLFLAADGGRLAGEDTLVAPDAAARARLAARLPGALGGRFVLRFHLDPDVAVRPALGGRAAVLTPPGGAPAWMLRADGVALAIAPSAARVPGRLHPRATKQVVVTGLLAEYWGRVSWSLDRLDRGATGGALCFAPGPL